jgi:putative flippase GtrA
MSEKKTVIMKQMARFLVAGGLAVSTDFAGYWLLNESLPVDLAKGISFIAGSVVSFFLNKQWTFQNTSTSNNSAPLFVLLYVFTFACNVLVNNFMLAHVSDMKLVGFLFATAASTFLNFFGMKYWVFSFSR